MYVYYSLKVYINIKVTITLYIVYHRHKNMDIYTFGLLLISVQDFFSKHSIIDYIFLFPVSQRRSLFILHVLCLSQHYPWCPPFLPPISSPEPSLCSSTSALNQHESHLYTPVCSLHKKLVWSCCR